MHFSPGLLQQADPEFTLLFAMSKGWLIELFVKWDKIIYHYMACKSIDIKTDRIYAFIIDLLCHEQLF